MTATPRRSRLIATLGPASESPEVIAQLVERGVDVVRLNMSHAAHPWVRMVVPRVREAAAQRGRPIAVLMDTQGPAIRTGDLPAPMHLVPGTTFYLAVAPEARPPGPSTLVNYPGILEDIRPGDLVMVDNGVIEMRAREVKQAWIECEVLTEGTLGNRRHINLPGVEVRLPALTDKDRKDAALAAELQVDYLAMSFVREAANLDAMRSVLGAFAWKPRLVSKIEDQQAVRNLEEIIQRSDAVMVARGDLGIEVSYEELPIIQRRIVKACFRIGRPVIVATHLLESMIQSPVPTRAEVTDVANAVFEQADALMLSGETTIGRYPARCVEVLDRIASRIERSGGAGFAADATLETVQQRMAQTAVHMADAMKADAILVFTRSGRTAREASWLRPRTAMVFAACESESAARSLCLHWGVVPVVLPFDADPEATIRRALKQLQEEGRLQSGQRIVILSAFHSGEGLLDGIHFRTL